MYIFITHEQLLSNAKQSFQIDPRPYKNRVNFNIKFICYL